MEKFKAGMLADCKALSVDANIIKYMYEIYVFLYSLMYAWKGIKMHANTHSCPHRAGAWAYTHTHTQTHSLILYIMKSQS